MSTPKISIIIPTYNAASTIGKTLESIFNQTLRRGSGQAFKNFEIIIVNDGSTDDTLKLLNYYIAKLSNSGQNKIKIINQENQGSNPARNRGTQEARGEYLLFCDSDLTMRPDMLEKMLNALEANPNKSFAFSSFRLGWKLFKLWPYSAERLRQMPCIHTSSLIKKEHFPGFDNRLKRLQDWDLWLTMLEQGHEGVYIPEILFKLEPSRLGISQWLPKIFYKIPWRKLGIKVKAVEKYEKAVKIIKEKHHLP
jgi:glycosyltransferase involved in cell wall biosynthesis